MPVLKHAKKKLRQDVKRTSANKKMKEQYKKLVKQARVKPTSDAVNAAVSSIDKAAKNNVIHKNKAARLKSSLAKVAAGKAPAHARPAKRSAAKIKATKAKAQTAKNAKKATAAKAPKK